MQELYNLTNQIHEILLKLAEKYGREIEIRSNCVWMEQKGQYKMHQNQYATVLVMMEEGVKLKCLAIEEDEIKQILLALKDVLGISRRWKYAQETLEEDGEDGNLSNIVLSDDAWCLFHHRYGESVIYGFHKSRNDELCHKWLDGLNPLFKSDPVAVLTELLEVLENLLK